MICVSHFFLALSFIMSFEKFKAKTCGPFWPLEEVERV